MIQLIVVFQTVKILIKNRAINFHRHNKGESLSTPLWTRITSSYLHASKNDSSFFKMTCTFWPDFVRDYFNKFWLINYCLPVDIRLHSHCKTWFWFIALIWLLMCSVKPANSWADDHVEKKRDALLIMGFCGAMALTSVQRCVWTWSQSKHRPVTTRPLKLHWLSIAAFHVCIHQLTPTRADCDKCWSRVT